MKKRTINKVSQLSMSKTVAYCKKLDDLIKLRETGSFEKIAEQLAITSTLAGELITYMKVELGCPIDFDRNENSFIYTRKGKFVAGFLPESNQ